ncbi:helix-turn-helix domain-containing protein [Thalassotalea agariperforans]
MNNSQDLADLPNKTAIIEQLDRIKNSKAFARSKINCKLLNFLVNYYLQSLGAEGSAKAPKEFEIATEALNKAADFNPAEDASIRVYVSNLRKKLETYYQNEGANETFQITIPAGGYGLELNWVVKQELMPINNNKKVTSAAFVRIAIMLSVLFNVIFIGYYFLSSNLQPQPRLPISSDEIQKQTVREHALWQPLFANGKSTLIVIGDLFMLTEVDPQTNILRAVREFSINSDEEFESYLHRFPGKRATINKANSAFLLKNSVFALQHILPLFTESSPATLRLASELTATDLRDYNIVYIGLYKSLGLLDAYLQGSNFENIPQPSSLKHRRLERVYTVTGNLQQEYTDYGSFAQFSGPSGNYFYIFAGFSDASVIQMAKYLTRLPRLTSAEFTQHFQAENMPNKNFELIFSASSFNRTDLDSNIVDSGLLDIKAIWSMPK